MATVWSVSTTFLPGNTLKSGDDPPEITLVYSQSNTALLSVSVPVDTDEVLSGFCASNDKTGTQGDKSNRDSCSNPMMLPEP